MIPFNQPFLTGKEAHYMYDAVRTKKLSGNGKYTKLCHAFFEKQYGFKKVLLTSSCTDALEMAAILIDIKPEDEVIMPSYTFVSTANAFVLRGARIVFADSEPDHPNMDVSKIESLITDKTRAIVPVHYAGMACDMDAIMKLAEKYKLYVIEDAAQAIDSTYRGRPLGGIGHMSAFSFHETKNVISGEGGMLVINDDSFTKRAEIIWEKGTNRAAFFRGEVDKYGWVDVGSSFLPSEIVAAFLYAQLENLALIQERRISIWNRYYEGLKKLQQQGFIRLPSLLAYASNNAHMFYIGCSSVEERDALAAELKKHDIHAVFHYQSLHKSMYYLNRHDGRELINSDRFSSTLLRLPMYFDMTEEDTRLVVERISEFYNFERK